MKKCVSHAKPMHSFQENNHATIPGRISRGQNQTYSKRQEARPSMPPVCSAQSIGMEDIVIDLYSLVFPSDYSLSLSPDPPSFFINIIFFLRRFQKPARLTILTVFNQRLKHRENPLTLSGIFRINSSKSILLIQYVPQTKKLRSHDPKLKKEHHGRIHLPDVPSAQSA